MTQGPWKWSGEVGGEPGVHFGDWHVVRPIVSAAGVPVVWALWVVSDGDLYFGFNSKEDAQLIASAPDLLRALKKIANGPVDGERARRIAGAAISRIAKKREDT